MTTPTIDFEKNESPQCDQSNDTAICCPRFEPEAWDDRLLHFKHKLFVRTKTRNLMHVPLNMSSVFKKTWEAIESAGARDISQTLVLSRDLSAWSAEHLFAVTKNVPEQEMVRITGEFRTKVFEGPYRDAGKWYEELKQLSGQTDTTLPDIFFFYTTCPGCFSHYGKNYVVGMVRTDSGDKAPSHLEL